MALKLKSPMWTLDEGRAEVERVQQGSRAYGYHVALGGSVLNKGESRKDLDLYFLPLDSDESKPDRDCLVAWLESLWGDSESLTDPRYAAFSWYAAKLRFDPIVTKRIDVFIVGPKSDKSLYQAMQEAVDANEDQ